MKKLLFLKICIVTMTVTSALAFTRKAFVGAGTVYCDPFCSPLGNIDWRVDPAGSELYPCDFDVNNQPIQPYVLTPQQNCLATPVGTYFSETASQ